MQNISRSDPEQSLSKKYKARRAIDTYIGIGSNLNDPIAQVGVAIEELRHLRESTFISSSSLYRSPPMGPADQPDYINAAVRLRTRLTPLELLEALWEIEKRHARVRTGRHWGPRTLDLDILLYAHKRIDEPALTVPHPGISSRAFVLYPLQEMASDLHIPGQGSIKELIGRISPGAVTQIS